MWTEERDATRMSELPYLSRGVGKRHSQDVMRPIRPVRGQPGPEENAEVKMELPHPELASRLRGKQGMSSPANNAETKEEPSTMTAKVDE